MEDGGSSGLQIVSKKLLGFRVCMLGFIPVLLKNRKHDRVI